MILLLDNLLIIILDFIRFIFYGIIQGLTEFIPVSSTAHLKIIPLIFGIDDPGSSISAIIQIGSVLAVFWYFRESIFNFKNTFSRKVSYSFLSTKLFKSIYIGTVPIVFFGGFIKLFVPEFSDSFLRSNLSIAIVSILMSLIMLIADISTNKIINLRNHKFSNSFLIGIAQAFAIIPGVSRSGATISMALFSGWERKDAVKFSFLLGIPSISLAAFVEFLSLVNQFPIFPTLPLFVGIITTFFSSLLAIDFLIKYVSSNGLKLFIYYRLVFGFFILLNL